MGIQVEIEKKLNNFTLHTHFASESRRIGILGASGCGKSMTLKSIAGIERPDRGRICVDGNVLYDSEQKIFVRPQKRHVGYLFQNYALFPTMTVAENITAGLHASRAEKQRIVQEMSERFQLQGLEKRLPQDLSGGQQQRVALARILAYEPEVILLDEPFSALDGFLKDHLQKEMQELLQNYTGTVILVSHSREEIYRFSEELLVLDQGKDVCFGKTQDIFADPGWQAAARLTGCRNITRAVRKDVHTLELPEWETVLHLQRDIPEDICAVGVREHAFRPVWNSVDGENACGQLAFELESTAKLPEELHCFVQTKGDPVSYVATGEVCRKLGAGVLPQALAIPEEAVLLLKE